MINTVLEKTTPSDMTQRISNIPYSHKNIISITEAKLALEMLVGYYEGLKNYHGNLIADFICGST